MRVLVLENDTELDYKALQYLKNFDNYNLITEADQVDTGDILEAFKTHDILVFKPTLITYSQYNLMVMAMYKLIESDSLAIKEIHIIYYDKEKLEQELRDLWDNKRIYLNQVLTKIKLYRVYPGDDKIELTI